VGMCRAMSGILVNVALKGQESKPAVAERANCHQWAGL